MASNNAPKPPPGSVSSSARLSPYPAHSRNPSVSSQNAAEQHRPSVPSGLRQTHMPPASPEDHHHQQQDEGHNVHGAMHMPEFESDGIHPYVQDYASINSDTSDTKVQGEIEEPSEAPNARSRLLDFGHKYHLPHECGEYNCSHGTFSPRPRHHRGYGSVASNYDASPRSADDRSQDGYGGHIPEEPATEHERRFRGDYIQDTLGLAIADGLLGQPSKRSNTRWLAQRHGIKHERWMYVNTTISCLAPICARPLIAMVGTCSTTSRA